MARNRGSHGYQRVDRVGRVLQEIVAWELEKLSDIDERLALLTVTDVVVKPDLTSAVVLFSSLDDGAREALTLRRGELQRAIARRARLKRTPLLYFEVDEILARAFEIEKVLRSHQHRDE